jgi:hypothetical protein
MISANGVIPRTFLSFDKVAAGTQGHPIISAQSGVAVLRMSIPYNTGLPVEQEALLAMTQDATLYYTGTLFDKMGFDREQILPTWGRPQNQFNRSNYNRYLGFGSRIDIRNKYENMVMPFTTNAYISAAEMIALSRLNGIIRVTLPALELAFEDAPAENLGGPTVTSKGNLQATTNASSDQLIASRLPKKLSYPYLVVHSDIVPNTSYYGGPEALPTTAMAYVMRNYTQGDFLYGEAQGWSYTADQAYTISEVTTSIRLPNGRPAPLNSGSAVIYTVTKRQAMPQAPTEEELKSMEKGV